jgi:glycine cleavage system H protein
MSDIPADLRYSQDHLWVRPGPGGGGLVRVGVTDFAQRSLGDVVEVTLPGLGETLKAGQACGDIESVKSVNDLVAPVAGTVRAATTTWPARRNSSTRTRTARAGCSRPRSIRPRWTSSSPA